MRPVSIDLHPFRVLFLGILLLCAGLYARPAAAFGGLFAPCASDCAVAVYAGHYVEDSLNDILFNEPAFPTDWEFSHDGIVAAAVSREWLNYRERFYLEPEFGIGQRFGEQDETEIWGAIFLRYRGFPWDHWVTTSIAISTGMNYATGTSEHEIERNQNDEGSRWLHFFSPEITFALPSQPNVELMFRLHHRSGIFGTINGARGGNQYGTVGLRWRF